MAKRIEDNVKISNTFTVEDWKKEREILIKDIHNQNHNLNIWDNAYGYFYERIKTRFFDPIHSILVNGNNLGEGFSVVALQCVLIEFLEAFYQGKIYTTKNNLQPYEYKSSEGLFINFLTNHKPFSNYFTQEIATFFYNNIRCGLVHEARTKKSTKIRVSNNTDQLIELEDDNLNKMVIYRENFQKALIQYLENYKDELLQNRNLMINFIRKFDDICDIERSYYFAYGSNLSKKRLLERIGKFHTASVAILKGYKFIYNKKSIDGTAKANLIKEPNSEVYGICYEIDYNDFDKLDKYEQGYNRITKLTVSLLDTDTEAETVSYISQSITEQPVFEDYRQIIIQSAKEWGINQNYINNSL